jgi:anaerobic magnesium-protoporphyrin IX monomethyl ester cyclase
LCYKDGAGKPVNNPDRPLIPDLDALPQLDYEQVEIKRYINPYNKSPFAMRYPAIGIVTSRGCPGRCVYCTVKGVWGRTWRGKSAIRTVDEIELLHTKYGIQEFDFMDDSASLDKKRWSDICDGIILRKLNIRWTTPNGIAHWTLDKAILKKMKRAGCYRVTFGIESGNPATREFLGKPFPLSQAREMIRYANSLGMWTIATNILGFPYETKKAMEDTLAFAKESGVDFSAFYLLAPHAASEVYQYFRKEGLLNFDFALADGVSNGQEFEKMNIMLNDGGINTKFLTAPQLKATQIRFYREFILYRALSYLVNPLAFLGKMRSREDVAYAGNLIKVGLKIFLNSFYKKTTKELLYD